MRSEADDIKLRASYKRRMTLQVYLEELRHFASKQNISDEELDEFFLTIHELVIYIGSVLLTNFPSLKENVGLYLKSILETKLVKEMGLEGPDLESWLDTTIDNENDPAFDLLPRLIEETGKYISAYLEEHKREGFVAYAQIVGNIREVLGALSPKMSEVLQQFVYQSEETEDLPVEEAVYKFLRKLVIV